MIPESDLPVMTVAPQDLDPQLFLGQSPDQLKNRLGAPSILRKEGNVEIWQYQLSDCVVDFFFYDKAGTLAATHTDMRSPFLEASLTKPPAGMRCTKSVNKPVPFQNMAALS